ncbi:hypothetical protein NNL21_12490 [Paenibacillus mendelii]|nr:hypothetical protein [Paenibacillus mendelii]
MYASESWLEWWYFQLRARFTGYRSRSKIQFIDLLVLTKSEASEQENDSNSIVDSICETQ